LFGPHIPKIIEKHKPDVIIINGESLYFMTSKVAKPLPKLRTALNECGSIIKSLILLVFEY